MNSPDDQVETYYRINLFLPFIDFFISQLERRFKKHKRYSNNQIKHSQDNVNTLKTQLELHLRRTDVARKAKDEASKQFENDKSTVVICFDLEKSIPTPNLTCSEIFYSRQLWTYNFCVHDLKTGRATMFMWY